MLCLLVLLGAPKSACTAEMPPRPGAAFLNVVLCRSFSNQSVALKSLISRTLRGKRAIATRSSKSPRNDVRGPMAEKTLQTQTRLSYPRRQELLTAYAAGTPVRQIAREFGIHQNTVTTIVNSEGAPVRRPRISSEAKAQALPLYEGGMSLAEVAKELGISSAGARAIIRDAGGTMRPAGIVRHPQH